MSIKFEKWFGTALFHSPLNNNALVSHQIEFRKDPLLGHVSIYSDALSAKKEIMFPETDREYLKEIVERTRTSCFLCDGKWEHTTPKYPEDLIPGGRLIRNECVLFPNLFPISTFHSVIMVGNRHHLSLDEFTVDLLYDALSLAFDFVKRVFQKHTEILYFTINANYLAPAGASLVHPHLQVLGSALPSTHHARLLNESKKFFDTFGKSYWSELVNEEKSLNERYIGQFQRGHLIASYSPIGVNEILGIWPAIKSFDRWYDEDVKSMAEMISKTLVLYHHLGFSTFNFSCFGGQIGTESEYEACVMRIICRQNVVPHHRTDDCYFQKLMQNEIIVVKPEKLARLFRQVSI